MWVALRPHMNMKEGETCMKPSDKKDETGHNPNGFTFWLAGGGVKAGFAYGATDPTGPDRGRDWMLRGSSAESNWKKNRPSRRKKR